MGMLSSYHELVDVSVEQMEEEMGEHFKRHGKAKRSWMNLYLQKLESAEEVDAKAEAMMMKFQAVGQSLTPATVGILVRYGKCDDSNNNRLMTLVGFTSLTYKTGSDIALKVLANSTRYRVWPEPRSMLRLLHYYAKKGNVEAVRALLKVAKEKDVKVCKEETFSLQKDTDNRLTGGRGGLVSGSVSGLRQFGQSRCGEGSLGHCQESLDHQYGIAESASQVCRRGGQSSQGQRDCVENYVAQQEHTGVADSGQSSQACRRCCRPIQAIKRGPQRNKKVCAGGLQPCR